MSRDVFSISCAALLIWCSACDGSDSAETAASRPADGRVTLPGAGTASVPNAPTQGNPSLGAAGSAAGQMPPAMTDPSALPPEREVELDLQLPQASENYVYAANPEAGTVAVIVA
jgi:hypothetical protein